MEETLNWSENNRHGCKQQNYTHIERMSQKCFYLFRKLILCNLHLQRHTYYLKTRVKTKFKVESNYLWKIVNKTRQKKTNKYHVIITLELSWGFYL